MPRPDDYNKDVQSKFQVVGSSYQTEPIDDIHVRTPFNHSDYATMRPNERIPQKYHDIVKACRAIYVKIGIVRNVIDIMTDFAVEELTVFHPDKKVEAFYRAWMKKVDLNEKAIEYVRHFLVDANVVIKRKTGKITKPIEKDWVGAAPDVKLSKPSDNIESREIPIDYLFLNVLNLEWLGGEVARIAGKQTLGFHISKELSNAISSKNKKKTKSKILDSLPADFIKQVKNKSTNINGKTFVELDMDKIYIAHNKKDAWHDWAPPFMQSIIPDIQFRKKLRLADTAALDGVINVIRLWKLGDHKEQIFPDDGAVDKLIEVLQSNVGGGAMDLVWDSTLTLDTFYPPIEKILGSEKYDQVNRDILVGLGIPEVLIGGKGSNFSNSWIQLKTLVEKLQYIRKSVEDWINGEVRIIAKSMGFKTPPIIRFKHMNVHDENITKRLVIGLLDRGVISVEAVLNAYGEDFIVEMERMKAEKTLFEDEDMEVRRAIQPDQPASETGRPPATQNVDQKTREAKPKTASGDLSIFALDSVHTIDKIVTDLYINNGGLKNARQLTSTDKDEIDVLRRLVLSNIQYNNNVNEESIHQIIEAKISDTNDLYRHIVKTVNQSNKIQTKAHTLTAEAIAWAQFTENNHGSI